MPTALVVDDLATDRRIAGGLLSKREGWSVLYASHGREALDQVEAHLPDLIVTDMQMPEMNGLELVQEVTKLYPLVPVILMTAQGSEEIAVQALQLGAASYVPKRCLAEDLVNTVERVHDSLREQRGNQRIFNRVKTMEYDLILENDLDLILAAVGYLRQGVTDMRLCDEAERLRVGIALEEALLNAFYHGNLEVSSSLKEIDHEMYSNLAKQRCREEPYVDRRIYVNARFTRAEARYTIRDEGPGFDLASLPDPTDPANLEKPSGRGVLLMRTFLDEVTYNEKGNEVVLVKRAEVQPESLLDEEE